MKICYAGARSTADIEHNGLTLNGVGNGTKIENIYILESADDAVEFFGGTVNVTNLLAVNPDDDMFDFTQGYSGKLKTAMAFGKAVIPVRKQIHAALKQMVTWMAFIRIIYVSRTLWLKI